MELWRQIEFLGRENKNSEAIDLWDSESIMLEKQDNYFQAKIFLCKSLIAVGDITRATEYVNSGLEYFKGKSDSIFISRAYSVLGIIGHIEKRYDDALIHFQNAYNYVSDSAKFEKEKANALNNIGSIQMLKEDYVSAEENLSNAIELFEFIGNFGAAATSYGNLARIYQKLNEHEKSLACLDRGMSIVDLASEKEMVTELIMLQCLGLINLEQKEKAIEKFNSIPIEPSEFMQDYSRVRYIEIKELLSLT